MAKNRLTTTIKTPMAQAVVDMWEEVGLTKVSSSTTSASITNATAKTRLTGNQEMLVVSLNATATGVYLQNTLSTPPLLIFTVANGEKPLEYHFFKRVDVGNVSLPLIISITRNAPAFDTAVQLRASAVNEPLLSFKGDGE